MYFQQMYKHILFKQKKINKPKEYLNHHAQHNNHLINMFSRCNLINDRTNYCYMLF